MTAGAAASSVGRTGLLAWLFGTGPQVQATQNVSCSAKFRTQLHGLLIGGALIIVSPSCQLNVGLKAYDTTEGQLLKTKLDKSKADGTLSTSNLGKAVPSKQRLPLRFLLSPT